MQADNAAKTWTDERIEELKGLWAEGLSARQIAERLGGMTRNTVMGKLDRLGLLGSRPPRDGGPHQADPGAAAPQRTPAPVAGAERRPIPAPPDTLEIQQRLVATGNDPEPVTAAAPAPSKAVGIHALTQSTCRWPIGDPQRDDFGYCGGRSLAGRPYCEAHSRLAYEPPRERRRAS